MLYENNILKSPKDIIKKFDGRCPECNRKLSFEAKAIARARALSLNLSRHVQRCESLFKHNNDHSGRMTFSIVAIDKENEETGFAISSCCWDSGQVGRADAGIGSIVSQARGYMLLRDRFFEKLGEGMSLDEVLEHFREIDEDIEHRQLGMITLDGDALSFTGKECSHWAGHKVGEDYACQGNILVGHEVVERMTEAFTATQGTLYDKLCAALEAGDDAGGDARGKQSARLMVVKKRSGNDVVVDISVEDHVEPVKELGRILRVGKDVLQGYTLLTELDQATGKEKRVALEKVERFLEPRQDRAFIDMWMTLGHAQIEMGLTDKAISTFKKYLEISPKMIDSFRELIKKGELPEAIIKRY